MQTARYLVTIALAVVLVNPVGAASWLECDGDSGKKMTWFGNSTSVKINTDSFPAGSVLQAAQRGVNITNTNPSPFIINHSTETGEASTDNGENEIYAASLSDRAARADMWYHCYWFFGWHYGMDEVDIVFDSTGRSWTASQSKSSNYVYNGSTTSTSLPIDSVIVHEAGHFLGLMHVASEYNVMGDSWRHYHTNGTSAIPYFGEDASRGARVLYGDQASAFSDVSASHWRRIGDDGEYSSHDRVRVRNSANNATLPPITIKSEPGYIVNRGSAVRPEFTIENNGKQTHANVTFGIYVSTDDFISYSDRRIGGGSFGSLHPDDVLTTTILVTIPNDLTAGQNYWLGIIVDEDNSIAEINGANNRAYIPIRVQ